VLLSEPVEAQAFDIVATHSAAPLPQLLVAPRLSSSSDYRLVIAHNFLFPRNVHPHNRFTGLVDLFTMATGAVDVVIGATQCAAGAGTGLPPPRIGITLKGDAAMALYNLCEMRLGGDQANYLIKEGRGWRGEQSRKGMGDCARRSDVGRVFMQMAATQTC
jgi:hypothetical protein